MASITILNDGRSSTDTDVIAHLEGCQDIARLLKNFPHQIEETGTAEYATEREVFLDYNADFIEGDDESGAWDITFAPCCKLPKN